MSCLVGTWFCVIAVMASAANHLGVRINTAAAVVGATWTGALLAAGAVTVTKLAVPTLGSPAYTTLLGVMAPLFLFPMAIIRVATSPPYLWAQGMQAALSFGLMKLQGYSQPSIAEVWYLFGTLTLSGVVAAGLAVLVAWLVLPTHATQEVQDTIADTLLLAGVATSRYGARLFRPSAGAQPGSSARLASAGANPPTRNTTTTTTTSSSNTNTSSTTSSTSSAHATSGRSGGVQVAAAGKQEGASAPASTAGAAASAASSAAPADSLAVIDDDNNDVSDDSVVIEDAAAASELASDAAAHALQQLLESTGGSSSLIGTLSGGTWGEQAGSWMGKKGDGQGKGGSGFAAAPGVPWGPQGSSSMIGAGAGGGPPRLLGDGEGSYHLGEAGAALVMQEAYTDEEWLELIHRNSTPHTMRAAAPQPSPGHPCPIPQPPVASLRPRLFKAQGLFLGAAAVEPQWVRGGWATLAGRAGCFWFDVAAWGKAAAALQVLLTRLSALEAVLEDGETLHFHAVPGSMPLLLSRLRHVYSQAATSLALMSREVRSFGTSSSSSGSGGGGRSSGHSGGRNSGQQADSEPLKAAAAAAAAAEEGAAAAAAATAAAAGQTEEDMVAKGVARCHDSWAATKAELSQLMQQQVESHWRVVVEAEQGSPAVLPTLTATRHLMFTWSLTAAIIDALHELESAVRTAAHVHRTGAPYRLPGLLYRLAGWALPTWPAYNGWPQLTTVCKVLGRDLPAAFRLGWKTGVHDVATNPRVQAGFKYWVVLVLVLEATLALLHCRPDLRAANPTIGVVSAALCMFDKVEATVSKVSFWTFGTLVGGLIGWLAMLHPALATNPYSLTAVVAGWALLVGTLNVTQWRVGITLTLMTVSSLVLCQCCGHVGTGAAAIARVASVLAGAFTAVIVCNFVLPWYTSTCAIATMSDVYVTAALLVQQLHVQLYAGGAAAVAAYEARPGTSQPPAAGAGTGTAAEGAAIPGAAQDAAAAAAAAGLALCGDGAAAVAAAAAQVVAAAGSAGLLVSQAYQGRHEPCPRLVTPGVLQSRVTQPLVQVQTSLLADTVVWQRGVLATPPVVPALLQVMFGLLDRLAALQLSVNPPGISGLTGYAHVHYGVRMAPEICRLLELQAQLAAATAAVLRQPDAANANGVRQLLCMTATHRVEMYRVMQRLRQQLHAEVHAQQQQCKRLQKQQQQDGGASDTVLMHGCRVRRQMAALLGGVDDVVQYMGFQFASIKVHDRLAAVAHVAAADACMERSGKRCALK